MIRVFFLSVQLDIRCFLLYKAASIRRIVKLCGIPVSEAGRSRQPSFLVTIITRCFSGSHCLATPLSRHSFSSTVSSYLVPDSIQQSPWRFLYGDIKAHSFSVLLLVFLKISSNAASFFSILELWSSGRDVRAFFCCAAASRASKPSSVEHVWKIWSMDGPSGTCSRSQ